MWAEGPKIFLGVNMRCRKDFAVGKEIRTSRKITKQQYKTVFTQEKPLKICPTKRASIMNPL